MFIIRYKVSKRKELAIGYPTGVSMQALRNGVSSTTSRRRKPQKGGSEQNRRLKRALASVANANDIIHNM